MMRVARAQLIETLSIFVQLLAVILANSTDFCFIYSLPWLLNFFRILKLIRSSLCYLTPSFFIWSLSLIKSFKICVENGLCCCHNSIIIPTLLQLRFCFWLGFLLYPTIPPVFFHSWHVGGLIFTFFRFQDPPFLCQTLSHNSILNTVNFLIRLGDQSHPSDCLWGFWYQVCFVFWSVLTTAWNCYCFTKGSVPKFSSFLFLFSFIFIWIFWLVLANLSLR
jgi:hypothetical protein